MDHVESSPTDSCGFSVNMGPLGGGYLMHLGIASIAIFHIYFYVLSS
jgi:hypothetical protein